MITLSSMIRPHGRVILPGDVDQRMIVQEPMLYSSSIAFAYQAGGELTRRALDHYAQLNLRCPDHLYPVIDTRTHMLMKDQLPAIGGWHGDSVPRTPDLRDLMLNAIDPEARHFVMYHSEPGALCPTEFYTEDFDVPEGTRNWAQVHKYLEDNGDPEKFWMSEGSSMYEITSSTLHRATWAQFRGWRWFFRLSWYQRPPINEVRTQTQVYIRGEEYGW